MGGRHPQNRQILNHGSLAMCAQCAPAFPAFLAAVWGDGRPGTGDLVNQGVDCVTSLDFTLEPHQRMPSAAEKEQLLKATINILIIL